MSRDLRFVSTERSPRLWAPVFLKGRVMLPTDMCVPVLQARPKQRVDGERINDLSPLPPEAFFRHAMLDAAQEFVRQMAQKRSRYRLQTNESDLVLAGPFQHRPFGGLTLTGNPEATAYAQDEWLNPEGLDFRIGGWFIAEYGYATDLDPVRDGQMAQTAGFNEWQRIEQAAARREARRAAQYAS